MRSRCAAGIFHRSAVFSSRICLLLHLTIRPPESDSNSESYRSPQCETEKYRKPLDSISYGSGIRAAWRHHDVAKENTNPTPNIFGPALRRETGQHIAEIPHIGRSRYPK